MKKKLLLVGFDSFDWKVINPLLQKGKMPNLQKLIDRGTSSKIETLDPPFSPMLWTSIATGKTADKHGIHGFIEPNIAGGNVRPVSSVSRTAKALWNIFTNQGIRSNVIGWWPSTPVEPIDGIMVSNTFQNDNPDLNNWTLDEKEIHPAHLYDEFKNLRVHPSQIPPQLVLDFVPNAKHVDQEQDNRLSNIVKFLAHSFTIRNAAIRAMSEADWDFTAVYFDAPDHFSHNFMRFHPPKLDYVSQEQYDLYHGVINRCYEFHDILLGELLHKAGDNVDVVILSDHGFHSDHLRPTSLPKFNAAPAIEHNPYGVFVCAGNSFVHNAELTGINLLNIAPSILHYFGLPVGADMDGSVMESIFANKEEVKSIGSWENVAGEFGSHPEFARDIGIDDAEAIQQLEELGYIEREEGISDAEKVAKTIRDGKYNLASVFSWKGEHDKALAILEELLIEAPQDIRFNIDAIKHYFRKGLLNSARKQLDILKQNEEIDYIRHKIIEAKLNRLSGDTSQAIALLSQELEERPKSVQALLELSKCEAQKKQYDKELAALNKALAINPSLVEARLLKAINLYNAKSYNEAAQLLLDVIDIRPNQKLAHFYLGLCLKELNNIPMAISAFETTLKLAPRFSKARQELISLLQTTAALPELIEQHQQLLKNDEQEVIYIVTGLPRSGTSMTMQMLKEAGISILTDNERKPDENNPKGYFEYEAVKRLHRNNSWLADSKGKAVKVVLPHLFMLPDRFRYKVIHVKRDVGDVLMSQETMKKRINPKHSIGYNYSLYQKFEYELQKLTKWAEAKQNVDLITLDYTQTINNPELSAEKLLAFIEADNSKLDKIASAIDQKLYRTNNSI